MTAYKKLEEELVESRRTSQEEMVLFMEEQVGANLSNMSNQRMKIESRLRHNHKVGLLVMMCLALE